MWAQSSSFDADFIDWVKDGATSSAIYIGLILLVVAIALSRSSSR